MDRNPGLDGRGSSRAARMELGCPLVHARLHDTEPWGWEGLGRAGKGWERQGKAGGACLTSHSLPTSAFFGAPLFIQHPFVPQVFSHVPVPLGFPPLFGHSFILSLHLI